MEKIRLYSNSASIFKKEISCFNSVIAAKKGSVFSMAQTSQSKGLLSQQWGEHLLSSIGTSPIKTEKGFNEWLNNVWEDFYNWGAENFKNDQYKLNKFEKEGSIASVASIWLDENLFPTFFCVGNAYVLKYNSLTNELFAPYPLEDFSKWINNESRINWINESLPEIYFEESKTSIYEGDKYILCNKNLAKQFIITYLILKSKDDAYWLKLEALMRSDEELSESFFKNRNAYDYTSYSDFIEEWCEYCATEESFSNHIGILQSEGKLDKTDCSISIINFDKEQHAWAATTNLNYYKPNLKTNPVIFVNTINDKVVDSKVKVEYENQIKYKSDSIKFIDILLDYKIFKLYHFTDRSNIKSIIKNRGLLSWHFCDVNNININKPGGDYLSRMLDQRFGLHDYVRCSFVKEHPMMFAAKKTGRIIDPIILEIDPKVVTFEETFFSDMNATKNGHNRGKNYADFLKIHFETVCKTNYFDLPDNEVPFYQAEIMIKTFLPTEFILNINDFD